jgi:hypothetical protein
MGKRLEIRDLWSAVVLVWATALTVGLLAMPVFFGWTAEGWASLAQWLTAAIALAAAIFALRQVQEARRTRERQTQPNVVLFADVNSTDWHWVDVIIKNFGQTAAYNIRLEFDLWPTVMPWEHPLTGEIVTKLRIPRDIPVLAPSQEWRTLWDAGEARLRAKRDREVFEEARGLIHPSFEKSLPDDVGMRFEGRVLFEDSEHRQYCNPCVLDLDMFFDMRSFVAPRTTQN